MNPARRIVKRFQNGSEPFGGAGRLRLALDLPHITVTDSSGQTIAETTGGPSEIKIPVPRQFLGQQITVKVTIPGYTVQTYIVIVKDDMSIANPPEGR